MVIVKNVNLRSVPNNFTGIVYFGFYKDFIKNKNLHRYYGTARIWYDGDKSWWFNNKPYGYHNNYSQRQFIKDLNKLWLL